MKKKDLTAQYCILLHQRNFAAVWNPARIMSSACFYVHFHCRRSLAKHVEFTGRGFDGLQEWPSCTHIG